jgi:hypothetical protein
MAGVGLENYYDGRVIKELLWWGWDQGTTTMGVGLKNYYDGRRRPGTKHCSNR